MNTNDSKQIIKNGLNIEEEPNMKAEQNSTMAVQEMETETIEDKTTGIEMIATDTANACTVQKKLRKDKEDKMLFGVCSGIAKYLGWSPWRVRILLILLTLFGGGGVLAYVLLALDMPKAEPVEVASTLEEAHAL